MQKYFITGVSSGIGRELAKQCIANGHQVWGIARRESELKNVSEEINNPNFSFSVCDITNSEQVYLTKSVMENKNFIPDIIILNAGINPEANEISFSTTEINEVLQTNYIAAIRWIDIYLPIFLSRNKGHFVGISSLSAYRGDSRWIGYSASKSALSRSFESFRGRYTEKGINFTTIHLGAVNTGMGSNSSSPFKLSDLEAANKIIKAIAKNKSSQSIPIIPRILLFLFSILTDQVFSKMVNKFGDKK